MLVSAVNQSRPGQFDNRQQVSKLHNSHVFTYGGHHGLLGNSIYVTVCKLYNLYVNQQFAEVVPQMTIEKGVMYVYCISLHVPVNTSYLFLFTSIINFFCMYWYIPI